MYMKNQPEEISCPAVNLMWQNHNWEMIISPNSKYADFYYKHIILPFTHFYTTILHIILLFLFYWYKVQTIYILWKCLK